MAAPAAAPLTQTQIIKQSIALRAKYRVHKSESGVVTSVYSFGLVVPHPKNRAGDGVRSLRTKELSGVIATEGCDAMEASSSAVAVEDRPASEGLHPTWQSFQMDYHKKVRGDPDMAEHVNSCVGILGSLSHSHFACMSRNILAGKRGCECPIGSTTCSCKNKPIVDQAGNYTMVMVRSHDPAWADLIEKGLAWEVLSWKMDAEEADASMLIPLALNKKNDAAMKTAHTEIMSTLANLSVPQPGRDIIPFEPIRDKMLDLYGSAVDHPDFLQAFRFILDIGGPAGVHWQGLADFTATCVNPNARKMRFEAYAVVTALPEAFPRLKVACLKWAYKQTPTRTWCVLPTSIAFRLDRQNKFGMHRLMSDLEEALLWATRVAATVVAKGNTKAQVLWLAEVDINIIGKVIATPKKVEGKQVAEQEVR